MVMLALALAEEAHSDSVARVCVGRRGSTTVRLGSMWTQIMCKFGPEMHPDGQRADMILVWVSELGECFCPFQHKQTCTDKMLRRRVGVVPNRPQLWTLFSHPMWVI